MKIERKSTMSSYQIEAASKRAAWINLEAAKSSKE